MNNKESTNWAVMSALVRKDGRLFSVPTMGLFVLTSTCYMIAMFAFRYGDIQSANGLSELLFAASMGGILLVALLAAVFGGVAIAGERSDRTADFLALLPVSRRQIVMSKWIAGICILGIFVACNLLIAACATLLKWIPGSRTIFDGMRPEDFEPIALWIGMAMSSYGVAWLLSTLTRSAPISASVSIAVTIVLPFAVILFVEMGLIGVGVTGPSQAPQVFVLGFGTHVDGIHDKSQFEALATALCAMVVGITSLLSGTVYYLRRIAP